MPSILRRIGIRKLPGVCWYSVKRMAVVAVNQGGTADKCFIRPWQKAYFCQGRFVLYKLL